MAKFIPINIGKGHINYRGVFIQFILKCFLVGFVIIFKKRNNFGISFMTHFVREQGTLLPSS